MPDISREYQEQLQSDRNRQEAAAREDRKRREDAAKQSERHQKNAETANAVKNLAQTVTPMGVFSLMKQASLLKDIPFVCAFGAAILKDISDLVFNETVILGFLFSILCSIFIFMMILLAGSGKKGKAASKIVAKTFTLLGGGLADSLPGLGFLPIETLTVLILYMLVLSERANARE
jgi:hypothetical protein